jgi:hypothetical protein
MVGFKNCGIFPFNSSEVTDRQTMPSKAVRQQTPQVGLSVCPNVPLFSPEKEELYKKRFE